ncbi:2Fe-2S iron-sulfur cluster-binding protein [Tenacibaculum tangerinum]|uniref:2Fe-2S iron-sulfur cluster-binding protein n=1 Tax=Tenacibaculum tangerinum TaxID=3038772 RepID=A0ABY8KYZ5_9FLAO|nr:2Fe-2S iron-sulfur cluster-binding protein [Tenacibaculum tangerinum]WGH74226.1 2Fe-2S iron-sulfur cluster-binding protein [Tenacibaculum tangerinum]
MKKITIGESSFEFKKGTSMSDLYDFDTVIPFQCLKGRCGRCLVKTNYGDLGEITSKEKKLLKRLGFSIEEHRLLCQCTLEENSEVLPVLI